MCLDQSFGSNNWSTLLFSAERQERLRMLSKGQDIYWTLWLIRGITSQRRQISPFVLLFKETKGRRIKVISRPSGKILNKVQRINQCFAKTGRKNRWKKRLFYQDKLHCSLNYIFVSNANVLLAFVEPSLLPQRTVQGGQTGKQHNN